MIVKPSTKAEDLAFLEEIMADEEFADIPGSTQDKLKSYKRGLWGERDTAHMIDRYFHGATNTAVLHDVRLPDGMGRFAQFDHILLNRIAELATIVEVKNYAGTLSKNEHDEWIVWYKGQKLPKDIPNPVAQAQRQREVLRAWMRQRGLGKAFPNISVFVAVPAACKIDRSKVGKDVPIVKSDNLFSAWESSWDVSGLDILLSPRISSLELQRLATILARAHVPGPDIYDQLGLRPTLPDDDLEVGTTSADEEEGAVPLLVPAEATLTVVPVEVAAIAHDVVQTPTSGNIGTASQPPRRRASSSVELCSGIFERLLPDGRIGFTAHASNPEAKRRLDEACVGRAAWISRYQNWVCDDDRALEIRAIISADQVLAPADGSGDKRTRADTAPPTLVDQSTACPVKRRASAAVSVCRGITERSLPDGRVAFRANTDEQSAREILAGACRGRGKWQPVFKNWIVEADTADEVRTAVRTALLSEHPQAPISPDSQIAGS